MAEPTSGTEAERTPTFAWGPVWAGFFVVAALQIVLQLLGVAVGITALHPSRRSIESVSIWSAVWIAISTLSAFFFGGWFSVAVAATDRRAAQARAVLVWAFATTLGVAMVTMGLGGAVNVARALAMPGVARGPGGQPYAIGGAWATFGTLALSFACTLIGARLGVGGGRRRERRAARRQEQRGRVAPVDAPASP
jgi:hypothetical protein